MLDPRLVIVKEAAATGKALSFYALSLGLVDCVGL
jgi:hypothetical protein